MPSAATSVIASITTTSVATSGVAAAAAAVIIAAPIVSTLVSSLSLTPSSSSSSSSRTISTHMCVEEKKQPAPVHPSVHVDHVHDDDHDDDYDHDVNDDNEGEQVLLLPIVDITQSSNEDRNDDVSTTPSTSVASASATFIRLRVPASDGVVGVDMARAWQAPAIDSMTSIIAIALQSNHMNGSALWPKEIIRLCASYAIVHRWVVLDNGNDDSTPYTSLSSLAIHDTRISATDNTHAHAHDLCVKDINWWKGYNSSLTCARYAPSVICVNDELIFAGGSSFGLAPVAHVESINYITHQHRHLSDLNIARATPVACRIIINNIPHMLVAGGFDSEFKSLNSVEVLPLPSPSSISNNNGMGDSNKECGVWRLISSMLYHRHQSTMVSYNNDTNAIIFGGYTLNGSITATVERYSSVNNTWQRCRDMPEPRAMATAINIANGILLLGGNGVTGRTSSMWYYDTRRDVWHILAITLPCAMSNASAHWDEAAMLLHLIGGNNNDDVSNGTVNGNGNHWIISLFERNAKWMRYNTNNTPSTPIAAHMIATLPLP